MLLSVWKINARAIHTARRWIRRMERFPVEASVVKKCCIHLYWSHVFLAGASVLCTSAGCCCINWYALPHIISCWNRFMCTTLRVNRAWGVGVYTSHQSIRKPCIGSDCFSGVSLPDLSSRTKKRRVTSQICEKQLGKKWCFCEEARERRVLYFMLFLSSKGGDNRVRGAVVQSPVPHRGGSQHDFFPIRADRWLLVDKYYGRRK